MELKITEIKKYYCGSIEDLNQENLKKIVNFNAQSNY